MREFDAQEKPDFVFVAAAKVGGILANNNHPAQFLYENLQIQNHLIHGAHEAGLRTFEVYRWRLNEGSVSVRMSLGTGTYDWH